MSDYLPNITTGGTTTGPLINPISGATGIPWFGIYPPPQPLKSSHCPFCTPRCPHGFPADDQPAFVPLTPWQSPFYISSPITGPTTAGATVTYTSH